MSIEFQNVNYVYSKGSAYEKYALKNINLTIEDGKFIAVIGHTGSGKSTLIQHMNALMKPTSGTILYKGEDIWAPNYNRRQLRFGVGLVFQYPEHQLFEETVMKDVCFGPKNQGLDPDACRERAEHALTQVGFSRDLFEKSPFELSGGQKRRVAIAGVLAMNPDVLILDEPTAGLDPVGRDEILDQIAELQKLRNITVILVSHSMDDVAKYADQVLVMHEGECVFFDEAKEVFKEHKKLETMGLSAPQISYVLAELKEKGLDVDTTAITLEEACGTIVKALGAR